MWTWVEFRLHRFPQTLARWWGASERSCYPLDKPENKSPQTKFSEHDVDDFVQSRAILEKFSIGKFHTIEEPHPTGRIRCWCVTVSGIDGIATLSGHRRQPSWLAGSHSRLNTIARISASASNSRREERRAHFRTLSMPRSCQSLWSIKHQDITEAEFGLLNDF